MATLGSVYKGGDTGLKVNKTFMVPAELLYIDTDYNVRDIDYEHAAGFTESYMAGKVVDALKVRHQPDGRFKIIDGQHRFIGGTAAGQVRYECKDAPENELDQVSLMVRSSQGKPLTPLQRAKAYLRMQRLGLTPDEIAMELHRSRADIDNHLILAEAGDTILQHVESGTLPALEAIAAIRKHGVNAEQVVLQAVARATNAGEKKVRAIDLDRFTPKMQVTLLDMIISTGFDAGGNAELQELIEAYNRSRSKN